MTRADVIAFHYKLRETPYQANPARRVKKNREEEKKRFLSDAEQVRLGEVLVGSLEDGTEGLYQVSALLLLMLAGCRLNEILTLRWDFVSAHHLNLPDSKTGKRRIPLPREAYEILAELPRVSGNPYPRAERTFAIRPQFFNR